jgi:hypothetical protein
VTTRTIRVTGHDAEGNTTNVDIQVDVTNPVSVGVTAFQFGTASQKASLPTSGPAWDRLYAEATATLGTVNLGDQNSFAHQRVLAGALTYWRNGTGRGKAATEAAILGAMGSEVNNSQSALAAMRTLGGILLAAKLVGLSDSAIGANGQTYGVWRQSLPDKSMSTSGPQRWATPRKCTVDAGNNWGGYARWSTAMMAIVNQDQALFNQVIRSQRQFLGDMSMGPMTFTYSADVDPARTNKLAMWLAPDWAYSQGIVQRSATRPDLDGINLEDACRDADGPPLSGITGSGISYCGESLDGTAMLTAILILCGYTDAATWGQNGLLRNARSIEAVNGWNALFTAYSSYEPVTRLIRYLTNSTSIAVAAETAPGRASLHMDWLTSGSWLK